MQQDDRHVHHSADFPYLNIGLLPSVDIYLATVEEWQAGHAYQCGRRARAAGRHWPAEYVRGAIWEMRHCRRYTGLVRRT